MDAQSKQWFFQPERKERPEVLNHRKAADHKGAQSTLEQLISTQRAKLMSAHAVQECLYEVLLYADDDNAAIYAETAHVVATLVEEAVDELDLVHLRRVMEVAERG